MKLALTLLTLILCFSAYAKDDFAVVLAEAEEIKVGDPWGEKSRTELYKSKPVYNDIMILSYQTPISALETALENHYSDFKDKAKTIANHCKKNYAKTWQQISCVTNSINKTFQKHKWPDTSTYCRAHAHAFKQTFEELEIRNSKVIKKNADMESGGHVINHLIIATDDGGFEAYAIDVGWAPNVIYPASIITNFNHDPNSDGISDNRALPEVNDPDPKFKFSESPCPQPLISVGDLLNSISKVFGF